ncbi:MinD/ParA family protein [Paremcibacter congregatus]|uniref:MinD/ParA family protein n=1 Tax=Paremcibacter congregatus TaxID=2043170 RepID=UPI0030ECAE74|tara:strand:- start:126 stop:884 length:759 start_codon:yes stop_codon:yes gene_type:complete
MTSPVSSQIITIASGKGGVGKTWVSTTLCHLLASEGKKILLFDGDLGLANVDIQLGLLPEADLGQVLSGAITLDQAITRYDSNGGKRGFDIISGQSGSGSLASIRKERLEDLNQDLVALSKQYDLTFLDLGAGVESSVMTLCETADRIVVVVTSDPTSLTDAYAFIKMNHMRNPAMKLGIIVNMVEDRHEGQKTFATLKKVCENFLRFTPEYLGSVRRDKHVVDAIRHQKPLLQRHPVSRAGEDIAEIAKKL